MYKFYTNNCPKCMMLKGLLDKRNENYEVVDLKKNRDEMERLSNAGYKSTPLLEVDGKILEFREAVDMLRVKKGE